MHQYGIVCVTNKESNQRPDIAGAKPPQRFVIDANSDNGKSGQSQPMDKSVVSGNSK
jgi:hypothetical protein